MSKLIWEPKITNKNCKHDWHKLKFKGSGSGWFNSINIEFEYLYCPKCGSKAGDAIEG